MLIMILERNCKRETKLESESADSIVMDDKANLMFNSSVVLFDDCVIVLCWTCGIAFSI